MAKPINTWTEFKKTLRELKDEAVKERFKTIVVDTADIAYTLCEKYICQQHTNEKEEYNEISDFPFGKGYKLVEKEFDECLRAIIQLDYGLVIISHAIDKTFKDEQGREFNQIVPTLDSRGRKVCERACDIIGYARSIEKEDGTKETRLFLRQTSRFVAGSRFKYIPDSIPFTYDSLVNAIQDAIDKEAAETNNMFVTQEVVNLETMSPKYDFDKLLVEFQEIVGQLMQTNSPTMATKITKIVESHLGKGKKVGDCTPAQAEEIDLIIYDLKQL